MPTSSHGFGREPSLVPIPLADAKCRSFTLLFCRVKKARKSISCPLSATVKRFATKFATVYRPKIPPKAPSIEAAHIVAFVIHPSIFNIFENLEKNTASDHNSSPSSPKARKSVVIFHRRFIKLMLSIILKCRVIFPFHIYLKWHLDSEFNNMACITIPISSPLANPWH